MTNLEQKTFPRIDALLLADFEWTGQSIEICTADGVWTMPATEYEIMGVTPRPILRRVGKDYDFDGYEPIEKPTSYDVRAYAVANWQKWNPLNSEE